MSGLEAFWICDSCANALKVHTGASAERVVWGLGWGLWKESVVKPMNSN